MDTVKCAPYSSNEYRASDYSDGTSDCIHLPHVTEFIGLYGISCCANLRYELAREVLSV